MSLARIGIMSAGVEFSLNGQIGEDVSNLKWIYLFVFSSAVLSCFGFATDYLIRLLEMFTIDG